MHSRKKIDMIGKTYGRLTVVSEDQQRDKNGYITYTCECKCGNTKSILGVSLRKGSTRSCGCLQKESTTKHGMERTPEYKAWVSMKSRCLNPNHARFSDWGGRGITISNEWLVFDNFIKDMGNRPTANHSLDRVDNELGYSKSNCAWVDKRTQALNRRGTIKVMHNNKIMFVHEYALLVGLTESGARKRIARTMIKNINGVFTKEEDL